MSTIPPFFNHIYAILTYPQEENLLSDMAELSLEAEGVVAPEVVLFKKRNPRPKGNIRKDWQHQFHHKPMILPTTLLQKMTGYNVTETSAGTRTPA